MIVAFPPLCVYVNCPSGVYHPLEDELLDWDELLDSEDELLDSEETLEEEELIELTEELLEEEELVELTEELLDSSSNGYTRTPERTAISTVLPSFRSTNISASPDVTTFEDTETVMVELS